MYSHAHPLFRVILLLLSCLPLTGIAAPARLTPATFAPQGFPEIHVYKLENGLTIGLWPDANAKLVTSHVWFRAGALYENPNKTGVAHLLEHLVLGPSKYAPLGALNFEGKYGALLGATTKYKTTDFAVTTPQEHLEDILRFQADVITNLSLDEKKLKNEKQIVRNEITSAENSTKLALSLLAKALYPTHKANSFVTGEPSHLEKLSTNDCLSFYKSHYTAQNAVLIVTGQFDETSVLTLIENLFRSIPTGKKNTPPKDPVAISADSKIVTYKTKTKAYPMLAAYLLPFEVSNEDESALNFALYTLFAGNQSLVGSLLVGKQKIAQFVELESQNIGFNAAKINLTGDYGTQASGLIDQAVSMLVNLSPDQFETYATAFRADTLRRLQTTTQRATALGWHFTHRNGLVSLANDLNPKEKISLNDIKRVAAKYLTPERKMILLGTPAW